MGIVKSKIATALLGLGMSALPAMAGPVGMTASPVVQRQAFGGQVVKVQMSPSPQAPSGPTPGGGGSTPPDPEPTSPTPEPTAPEPSSPGSPSPEPSSPQPSKPDTSPSGQTSSRNDTRQSDGPSTTTGITASPLELALPSLVSPARTDRAIERDLQAKKVEDLISQMEIWGYFEGAQDLKSDALARLGSIRDGSVSAAIVMQGLGLALKDLQMATIRTSVADFLAKNPGAALPKDLAASAMTLKTYQASLEKDLRAAVVQAGVMAMIQLEKETGTIDPGTNRPELAFRQVDFSLFDKAFDRMYQKTIAGPESMTALDNDIQAAFNGYRAGTYPISYIDLVEISPQDLALAKVKSAQTFDASIGSMEN